ncbi:MAG: hypothetical protein GC208_10295 [Alphaproteobacteria bacterium]|nr:hypothetical protein [Alphaproteobacteria bacterium]
MEHKFAAFTAYAALVAQQELAELLAKHQLTPTPEVIADAAKFGMRRAFERFFPGLVKLPFANDPHPQIVLGLRYLYEKDPEGMGEVQKREDVGTGTSTRYRVSGASAQQRPAMGMSDTQQRRSGIIPVKLGDSSTRNPLPPPTPYPAKADESSHGAVGSGAAAGPGKLRRIGPAPVFPWEKRRPSGGSEPQGSDAT